MELLTSMEMIAQEKNMKLWIFDRIKELKTCLKKNLSEIELDQKILEIDEIAEYIQKQISPDTIEECIIDDLTIVSLEEVKHNIRDVIEESVEKNKYLIGSYVKAQQTYIEEAERNMKEIGNAEALYNQIQNSGNFCSFFGQIGKKLNVQIANSAKQFAEAAFQNYDVATNKVKNMLSNIQEKNLHTSKKELYHKYDTHYDLIKQELKEQANEKEYGGKAIERFGEEHTENVEKILKRNKKKRKYYKLVPLIIVLLLCFIPKIISSVTENTVHVEEIDQTDEGKSEIVKELLGKLGKQILEKKDVLVILKTIGKGMITVVKTIGKGMLGTGIIIAVSYWIYIEKVNKWYKQWVSSEVSTYLMPELEKFWQETALIEKVEESFVEISMELKNDYYELLNGILSDRTAETVIVDSREMEFQQIYKEWNIVKKSI